MRFVLSALLLTFSVFAANVRSAELIPRAVSETARQLQEAGGRATGGLIVHVGGEVEATAALASSGRFLIQSLVRDAEEVDVARSRLMDQDLYGTVTVRHWTGKTLPYVDDIVNILVVDESERIDAREIQRVLVPNGAAYVKSGETWKTIAKLWPDDLDEWSHWLHGPDNNAVSKDQRVGISRSLQWYMPPRWTRHHNLPAGFNALVSGGGRIYYLVDQAPNAVLGPGEWALVARDAFNGLELWRKPIAQWRMEAWGATERYGGRIGRFHGAPDFQAPRRIVVDGDRLFVTLGFHAPISVIDGATGKVLKKYSGTDNAGEIIYDGGILYVARNVYEPQPAKEILAVDADTGKTLWRNGDYKGIAAAVDFQKLHTNAFLTAGPNHVFLVDENDIVALGKKDGREAWKRRMPLTDEIVGDIDYRYSNLCTLVYHDGRVFFCQIYPGQGNMNKWEMKKLQIEAYDAETGKQLWDYTGGTLAHVTPADLFVNAGKVWTLDPSLDANGDSDARLLGLDCATGQVKTNFLLKNITHGHHHRCYRDKATEKYYLMGEEGIEYIDFETGESDVHYWLRGSCRYGIMPANGFVYVPPHNCSCYLGTLVYGLVALKTQLSNTVGEEPVDRVTRGPAYGKTIAAVAASETDWPLFRHDTMRSSGTPARLPDALAKKWTTSLGGQLTPPVIVGDRVFIASRDACQVTCLNATDGQHQWRFAADGPINAPPTYYNGYLVFGTRAGTLYVLTAAQGELVWSFQAGPSTAQIMAFGRLESPWPLNGSPLVLDDTVYCVAGRSMSLDGGLYVYRIDLKTGLLQQTNLKTNPEPKGETENNFLADMLVSDGTGIFMKSIRFDKDDISRYEFEGPKNRRGAVTAPKQILKCQTDMLDDSWLNCCFWAYGNCQAQQLAFDQKATFGINGPQRVTWGGAFSHDIYKPGTGYHLQKWSMDKPASNKPRSGQKKKGKAKAVGEWKNVRVGLRAKSMVLTNDRLYVAGTPDKTTAADFWAAYENREGATLSVVSRQDGSVLDEYPLDSEPVYNGLAAANGRLYVVTRNGRISCWGTR